MLRNSYLKIWSIRTRIANRKNNAIRTRCVRGTVIAIPYTEAKLISIIRTPSVKFKNHAQK